MSIAKINEEVKLGYELPSIIKQPTHVQLFRYSAVTWNTHRIHYDQKYAAEEGYPDVLVQSHLHGAFLTQVCTDWINNRGKLYNLDVKVKKYAIPGNTLTCKGIIVEKYSENNELVLKADLEIVNEDDNICVIGNALMKFPM